MGNREVQEQKAARRVLSQSLRTLRKYLPTILFLGVGGAWFALMRPGASRWITIVTAAISWIAIIWTDAGGPDVKSIRKLFRVGLKWRWTYPISWVVFVLLLAVTWFVTSVTFTSTEAQHHPEILRLGDSSITADSTTTVVKRIVLDPERPSRWSLVFVRPSGRMVAYRASDRPWVHRRVLRPWWPAVIHHPAGFPPPVVATGLVMPRMGALHPGQLRVRVYLPDRADEPIAEDTVSGAPFALTVSHVRPGSPAAADSVRWLRVASEGAVPEAARHPRLVSLWVQRRHWLASNRELRLGNRVRFILLAPSGDTAARHDIIIRETINDAIIRPHP